ncbi:MAG TPA: exo-alpha-sialidase [Sumerlaeia bacterium]|nr:exo-alpha-sialidase [Sumerlaeia bacterium]
MKQDRDSWIKRLGVLGLPILALAPSAAAGPEEDARNIHAGLEIPSENYVDQPYAVVTKDGNWLCVMTTGPGIESHKGQHVVATISGDKGRTWSPLIDIEPSEGLMASWVMPLIVPSGRVYAFYNYNGDGVDKPIPSVLGWYCCKRSDDNGRTWSEKRWRLPIRVTKVDRENEWQGKAQMFWGIGKPVVVGSSVFLAFTKCGKYVVDKSEGWFFRSDNILTEDDPDRIQWQLLPDGDVGLRAPEHGDIQSEENLVHLSNGDLYCMYRTVMGYPCHAYSRDGAHTWSRPEAATYTPGGRPFKHPRACPRIWRTRNGNFLFWFHNHGGKDYSGRNPVWISGGVEKDGFIHWSQPEILLYEPNPPSKGAGGGSQWVGMSYPDLIEQDGRYWITETQKDTARVHEVDRAFLEDLWRQSEIRTVAQDGLVLSRRGEEAQAGEARMPSLPPLSPLGGFSVDLWLALEDLTAGQIVLDSRNDKGQGVWLTTTDPGMLRIDFSDGRRSGGWDCDPGSLKPNALHHVVFIVDGGPRIISVVVDGQLCDGGTRRQYGWGRFEAGIGDVTGAKKVRLAPSLCGALRSLRIYDRYLRTSEAVGNFGAGV